MVQFSDHVDANGLSSEQTEETEPKGGSEPKEGVHQRKELNQREEVNQQEEVTDNIGYLTNPNKQTSSSRKSWEQV